MSLHDAIKGLYDAAKRLDAATFNPDMSALQKFVDSLDVKGLSATPPEDVRQKALEKFLHGSDDFTNRELRSLPFIIYESTITLDGAKRILRKLNFFKASHLRGLLNVYLTYYDHSAKTELLRQRLQFMPQEMAGNSTRLQKIFAAREFLFGDNRLSNMTKLFANRQSVNGSLEVLGLSNFFKVSNFIHDALKNFFRSNAPLSAQMKILTELDADYNAYQNIFPAVADALIQTVDRAGADKKICMEIFYHRLGDPRFTQFNWHGVSDKSREIFCHWLSEDDLETFFELIRRTAVDGMWRYREKFWRAYLPYVTKTKIFLGNNAAQEKGKAQLKHGKLTGAAANQSVFIFQIGRYIFSEWSHNGKLRAHRVNKMTNLFDIDENLFESDKISRNVLDDNFIAEWIHSSPATYFWQKAVCKWISRRCGIKTEQADWEV